MSRIEIVLAEWARARGTLLAALDTLPEEQRHFVPRPGLWTPVQQVLHIAGAEEGWLRHVLTGELDDWPPAYMGTAFELEPVSTVASLKVLLGEVHARTETYLRGLTDADLERVVETSWGQTYTVEGIFRYVMEHEIHHRGELYLILGLLGIDVPGF